MKIVWFSEVRWDYHVLTRKHHIISELAKRHEVLYIEPYTLGQGRPFASRKQGRISVLTLPTLRPSPFRFMNRLIKTRLAWLYYAALYPVVRIMLGNAARGSVLICSSVYSIPMVNWFAGPRYWDYNDDPEQFAPLPQWAVASLHRYLERADGIFASSRAFEKKLRGMTEAPVYYVPNGLHVTDFQGQPSRERIGVCYLGAILDWSFDFNLMKCLTERLPPDSIHIYGPVGRTVQEQFDEFVAECSVQYQGVLEYQDVPEVLSSYKVGIVPLRDNPELRRVASVKVLMYLAAGLMVVSRPMDEYEDFSPSIRMEVEIEAFTESVLEYLASPVEDKALAEKLVRLDWKHVVSEMEGIIASQDESLLAKR
ncbi:MAG: hypothetical protein V3W14_08645 [Candidatus Neomarinimicrobiota bacterium]